MRLWWWPLFLVVGGVGCADLLGITHGTVDGDGGSGGQGAQGATGQGASGGAGGAGGMMCVANPFEDDARSWQLTGTNRQLAFDGAATDFGVYTVGEFNGRFDLNTGAPTVQSVNVEGFITRHDPETLTALTLTVAGGVGDQSAIGMAASPDGTLFVGGEAVEELDAAGIVQPTVGTGGTESEIWVGSLTAELGWNWVHPFNTPQKTAGQNIFYDIAVLNDGVIAVAGGFRTDNTIGPPGGPTVSLEHNSGEDGLILLLDPMTGAIDHHRTFNGTGQDRIALLATHPTGVIVAGDYTEELDLGAMPPLPPAGTMRNAFIAGLDNDLATLWVVPLVGGGDVVVSAVAVGDDGTVHATVQFDSDLEVGDTTLAPLSNAAQSLAYVRVAPGDGDSVAPMVLQVTPLGSTGTIDAQGLAIGPCNTAWLAGNFTGELSQGCGSLIESNGEDDLFFATVDALGATSCTRYGGGESEIPTFLDVADGAPIVVGHYDGFPSFGGLSNAEQASDSFVVGFDVE